MPLLCRNSISYLVFTHLKNCHKYFFINNRNAHNWLLDWTLKKHYLRILTLVMNIAAFYSLLRKVFNCKQAKCKYHTNSAPFRSSHYCILPTRQDHLHQDCWPSPAILLSLPTVLQPHRFHLLIPFSGRWDTALPILTMSSKQVKGMSTLFI